MVTSLTRFTIIPFDSCSYESLLSFAALFFLGFAFFCQYLCIFSPLSCLPLPDITIIIVYRCLPIYSLLVCIIHTVLFVLYIQYVHHYIQDFSPLHEGWSLLLFLPGLFIRCSTQCCFHRQLGEFPFLDYLECVKIPNLRLKIGGPRERGFFLQCSGGLSPPYCCLPGPLVY